MNRPLRPSEINYVIHHLNLTVDTATIEKDFIYELERKQTRAKIIFKSNSTPLSSKQVEGIPVLFPSDASIFYAIDEHGNLVFYQDLLKSAFYLLSGYHEHFVNKARDRWGRVQYLGSIQHQLDIMHRPIVNEYFQILIDGFNAYLTHHSRELLKKKNLFRSFGFLLSHDIDVIDKFGWSHLGFKIKETIGLVPSQHSKSTLVKATIRSLYEYFNPKRANPFWNFDYLMKQEENYNIHASYYFLAKRTEGGSKYDFNESRLKDVYQQLIVNEHEVGIHGTTLSYNNSQVLRNEIALLEKASGTVIVGGRQHRLYFDLQNTFDTHHDAGLLYDTTFGFAEHEGFRNSFCLPFQPYDFEQERTIPIWQFPLTIMDVTLFAYRKLNNEQAISTVKKLADQVRKHNGILTLLWHNSFFDNQLYPGIKETYESILRMISDSRPDSITGKRLVELLNKESYEN